MAVTGRETASEEGDGVKGDNSLIWSDRDWDTRSTNCRNFFTGVDVLPTKGDNLA